MTKQQLIMFNLRLLPIRDVFKNTNVPYRTYQIDVSK